MQTGPFAPTFASVRRTAKLTLLGLMLVLVSGCSDDSLPEGPPVTSEPTEVSSSPEATPSSGSEEMACLDIPEEPSEGTARVELWFGDRADPSGMGSSLVVHRDIPATRAIATATLRAWIEGPTAEEEAAGALVSAPEGTELLEVDVDDGTAVVDLGSEFERTGAGTTYEGAILDQLAGTITQFETVDRALLEIDGESKPGYMGHGFIVDEHHPLVRPVEERYRTAPRC